MSIVLAVIGILMPPIFLGGLAIIQAGWKDKKKKRQEERERKQQEDKAQAEKAQKERLYRDVYSSTWTRNGEPIEIRNIPRLSFEQWLTFYNSSPEHWRINLNECSLPYYYDYGNCCIFPNYMKGEIDINIVWETPDDLHKFIMWQRNEYKKGNAAIFEEERARQMSKLTNALRDDMKQRHDKAQKEIEELEKQIAATMPKPKEEDPIQKCLREQREEKAKELNSSTDLIAYVCNKHPDYQYAESQHMLTGDGTMSIEVTLVHKHKPGNLIRETYFYDKKTKTWQESGMG